MGSRSLVCRGAALVCLLLLLLLLSVSSFCSAKGVEVVGVGECADCAENNLETTQAFSGLRVTIDCKPENGKFFKTRGSGELDGEGKFKVSLADDLVEDGKLKEQCYAQLHSASAQPCPSHDYLESSKIVFKSTGDDKHRLGLKGKLKFSPVTCVSASFWPHHHKFSPLPKLSPLKSFFHHHYPYPPIYKKPLPPPIPVYKPPVYKPHPVPVYKPPVYKPHPVPVYKPPVYKPHPVPVYKPPVPVYTKPLPPPVPIYKPKPYPPIPHKPLPPIPKIPPFPKKPCPPIPKLPPKYFHHPKFGKWPPLPPLAPYRP
ncbi:proline-rich protein 2 [Hibiscus trionum]|uniref:Proline-rich protein 2 n=1 Tax=Hibiscus trionum TaxID=183268 RepID=A0A9W7J2H9_HIBTR|nr:proline-rich protein 2 [Hibiscus trionum]